MSMLEKGSILYGAGTVECAHMNGVTGVISPMTNKANNILSPPYGMTIKSKYVAMINNTVPMLHVWDISNDEYDKVVIAQPPVTVGHSVEISDDQSMLAVGLDNAPYLIVYNTSDWSQHPAPASPPVADVNDIAFSRDGSLMAVASDGGSAVYIYNTSDWSKLTDPIELPPGPGTGVSFNHDDSLLAVSSSILPFLIVYNTSDWSKVTIPSYETGSSYGNKLRFSPDGSFLGCSRRYAPYATVYNTSDWGFIEVDTLIDAYLGGTGEGIHWSTDNTFFLEFTGSPGMTEFNAVSGAVLTSHYMISGSLAIALVPNEFWEINGTIDEALVADTWVATAFDYDKGSVVGSVEFTGTAFTIPLISSRHVYVTVHAKQGDMWKKTTASVAIGDNVFPTDPISTPYYYVATVAGTTGVTEPIWPVDAGGTVVDGSVTWQRVERLIQPVTQSPLIPTVV